MCGEEPFCLFAFSNANSGLLLALADGARCGTQRLGHADGFRAGDVEEAIRASE